MLKCNVVPVAIQLLDYIYNVYIYIAFKSFVILSYKMYQYMFILLQLPVCKKDINEIYQTKAYSFLHPPAIQMEN